MIIKIALIAALIIFIMRKFLGKSIQPKTKIKKDDSIVDAEYSVVEDDSKDS